jgi:hypothetical protein
MLVAIVREGPSKSRLMMSIVWLRPGASIAALQDAQRSEHGAGAFEVDDDQWRAVFGLSQRDVLARLLPLVLYLCSADADTS